MPSPALPAPESRRRAECRSRTRSIGRRCAKASAARGARASRSSAPSSCSSSLPFCSNLLLLGGGAAFHRADGEIERRSRALVLLDALCGGNGSHADSAELGDGRVGSGLFGSGCWQVRWQQHAAGDDRRHQPASQKDHPRLTPRRAAALRWRRAANARSSPPAAAAPAAPAGLARHRRAGRSVPDVPKPAG